MTTPPNSHHSGGDIASSLALCPDLAAFCGPEINEATLAKTVGELLRMGLMDTGADKPFGKPIQSGAETA